MKTKTRRILGLFLAMILLIIPLGGCEKERIDGHVNSDIAAQKEDTPGGLTVHYLDVGQGNAILVQSEGQSMLIDGGARHSSSFVVSYLEKQKIEKLDYILISHFDEDHLSGAVGALHKFPVDTLITPDYEADSNIFQSYKKVVEEKGYESIHPHQGQEFFLGSAKFRIISPVSYGHEDENQDSVGIILENGEQKFFIGGDIGLESEKEILESGVDIQADIMLMNHHGSHVSEEFFRKIDPSYSVISCGKDNKYGHPRQDTMELLKKYDVPVFRTDLQGTILMYSDGTELTFEKEPCNDYTPGNKNGAKEDTEPQEFYNSTEQECDFVLNAHTKKIHKKTCSAVEKISEDNKSYYKGDINTLLDAGYSACKSCKP